MTLTITSADLAKLMARLDDESIEDVDDAVRAIGVWLLDITPDTATLDRLIDFRQVVRGPVGVGLEAVDGLLLDKVVTALRGLFDPSPEQVARRIQRREDRIAGFRPKVASALRGLRTRLQLAGDDEGLDLLSTVSKAAKRFTKKEARHGQ